jgi:hypothetical protein
MPAAGMTKLAEAMRLHRVFLFSLFLGAVAYGGSQREREVPRPDDSQYSRQFFLQLRSVFGRFRDADLQRVFERAQPIQCSELINEKGEWRTVAFFNEKRELGDWYRSSFEEVKRDLSVFIFSGVCRGDHGSVLITTEFPVTESVEAYNQNKIPLEDVEVNVNSPVRASFDSQSQSYTWDLPYLFLVGQQDDQSIYSLAPPRLAERDKYARDVTDHWDCKSVSAENVTYQFLICRTTTMPRLRGERGALRSAFGASAYFILSDGREASSSVKLSYSDAADKEHPLEDTSVAAGGADVNAPRAWEAPDSEERILNLLRDEFRIRFNPQAWNGKIGSSQVLSGRQLSNLASAKPAAGADFCVWLPAGTSAALPLLSSDVPVVYSVTARDTDGQSGTSIVFDMKSPSDAHYGSLQCSFPRVSSAGSVAFSRWSSIVGDYLALEVRP